MFRQNLSKLKIVFAMSGCMLLFSCSGFPYFTKIYKEKKVQEEKVITKENSSPTEKAITTQPAEKDNSKKAESPAPPIADVLSFEKTKVERNSERPEPVKTVSNIPALPPVTENPVIPKDLARKTQKLEDLKPVDGKKEAVKVRDDSGVVKIVIPDRELNGSSGFEPKVVRIKAGQEVLWINEDSRIHYVNKKMAFNENTLKFYGNDEEDEEEEEEEEEDDDEEGDQANELQAGLLFTDSPLIKKGKSWGYKFDKTGTLTYYCFTHPLEMTGQIIIE